MKKPFLFMLSLLFVFLFSSSLYAAEPRFLDVPVKSWFHDAVYFCAEKHIMVGTDTELFSPEDEVTRAMFVTILGRSDGIEEEVYGKNAFPDVAPTEWYGPYVGWAAENGIVAGYDDGCFYPQRTITREEMMAMLHRYAEYLQQDSSSDTSVLSVFADAAAVSDWAREAAAWCVANDLISGVSASELSPRSVLSRAQVSKIMTVWHTGMEYTWNYDPVPGEKTLKNLINTALAPVGSTLYVYGGGWNKEDTAAGDEARTIGLDPRWKAFFDSQDASYDYREYRYYLGHGLDCSGYVGWTLYNTLEMENGRPGYVMSSTVMARTFGEYGWGTYTEAGDVTDFRAGDIMSTNGHVYIALGQCRDSSVVLLHSSPQGVTITGTVTTAGSKSSEAIALSDYYMKKYFPFWYQRYPDSSRGISYLREYSQMRWILDGSALLTDPHGYGSMAPKEILEDLLGY